MLPKCSVHDTGWATHPLNVRRTHPTGERRALEHLVGQLVEFFNFSVINAKSSINADKALKIHLWIEDHKKSPNPEAEKGAPELKSSIKQTVIRQRTVIDLNLAWTPSIDSH